MVDAEVKEEAMKKLNGTVLNDVKKYFSENNGLKNYQVLNVFNASNHPDDDYLYMVTARKENGTYACWTCWNQSRKVLNFGHYDLETEKAAENILEEFYIDIHAERHRLVL